MLHILALYCRRQQRELINEKKELRGIKQKLQSSEEKLGKDYEELKEDYQRLSLEYKKLRSAHEALQNRQKALSRQGTENSVPRPVAGNSQESSRKALPPERRPPLSNVFFDEIPNQKDVPFTIETSRSIDSKALSRRSNNNLTLAEAKMRTFIKENTSKKPVDLQSNILLNGMGGDLGKNKRPIERPEVKSIKRFMQETNERQPPKKFGLQREEGGPKSRMEILNYFQTRETS